MAGISPACPMSYRDTVLLHNSNATKRWCRIPAPSFIWRTPWTFNLSLNEKLWQILDHRTCADSRYFRRKFNQDYPAVYKQNLWKLTRNSSSKNNRKFRSVDRMWGCLNLLLPPRIMLFTTLVFLKIFLLMDSLIRRQKMGFMKPCSKRFTTGNFSLDE